MQKRAECIHNICNVAKNKIVGKDMKIAKVLLTNLLAVTLGVLAFFGVGLFANQNSTAKADETSDSITINIEYNIISTSDTVFVKYGDQSNDVSFDKNNKTLSNVFDQNGNAPYSVNATSTSSATDPNIVPSTDGSGNAKITTQVTLDNVNNTNFSLLGLYVGGTLIDGSVGWLYESGYSDSVITLTSLTDQKITYDIAKNYSQGNVLRVYCIVNPYLIKLYPGSEGGFQEGEGSTLVTDAKQVYVPYLKIMTFETPKPNNDRVYKFDGYFTDTGVRVTDNSGTTLTGWQLKSISLYAHYIEVMNITYTFELNGTQYTGKLQFDKSSSVDRATLESEVKNNDLEGGTKFPTDKNFYDWYTDSEMTTLQTFPLSGKDYTLYLKLAELTYNITFYVNPGCFWDGVTTARTYTIDFNSTLSQGLNKLRQEASNEGCTGAFATRAGYALEANGNGWSTTEDGSKPISTSAKIREDTAVYAIWFKQQYTIYFFTDGDKIPADQKVDYDTNLYEKFNKNPTYYTPTNTGNNFIGWAVSTSDTKNSYNLSSRPTSNIITLEDGTVLTMLDQDFTMPDHSIKLYGVWIQAYTVKFSLNKGSINPEPAELNIKEGSVVLTIENGETLLEALTRMGIADFFTNDKYKPSLENCVFQNWCYYADGNYGNQSAGNIYILDERTLNMDVEELLAHNIDLTKDSTVAAVYTFDKDVSTYTTAPSDTTSVIFAVVLVVISIALLVMLIISHKNNATIEINDKAIDAYKRIYGEDAPLPTFESTKPPFEQTDEVPRKSKDGDNKQDA